MTTITATMEQELKVQFCDSEKAKAYFIGGDYSKYFQKLSEMTEAAEVIMQAVCHYMEGRTWDEDLKEFTIFVEGVGEFVYTGNALVTEDNTLGKIIVSGDVMASVVYLCEVE